MDYRKKILVALAAGGLAAALFAGCGGSSAPAADAEGKTVMKTLVSATEPPLAWKDADGKIQGYEYDVLCEAGRRLRSYSLDIDAVPPETQDVMMESGEAKLAAGGYYRNPQRAANYIIPENPIGASALLVYVKQGEETKYRDLKEALAAGLRPCPFTSGHGAFRILSEWNEKNGRPLGEELPVQSGVTQAERIQAIGAGQYDMLIVPGNLNIEKLSREEGVPLAPLAVPVQVDPTVVLVNRQEPQFAEELNEALGSMRQDGTLSSLSEKWFGSDMMRLLDSAS